MPATEQPVALPTRYRVARLIARGGMASVWAAEDEVLGRRVAVKVLSRALDADERARRRFLREARAAARLGECRHVVTVYDIGEHEGRSFIVMEHFAGGTVGDRLRDRHVPRAVALRWLREAATALDCAHGRGVVHRDVKPGNLLLDERGRLAVGDFGIATVASEASVTMTGQVLGTAAYLSPEQARGEKATAASDRYALAVVAYELLTGRRPFEADHPAAQARAHVEAAVPDASAIGAGLPAAVGAVLRDGMAKDPGERPATAAELVDRLEAAMGDAAGDEPPPTEVTRRLAPVAPAPPTPRPRTPRPRSDPWTPTPAPSPAGSAARSRRVPLLLAVCALALVAGAVAAIALGGGGSGGAGDRTQARETGSSASDGERTSERSTSSSSSSRAASSQTTTTPSASTGSTAESTRTETQAQTQPRGQGDPKALNDQGFALIQQQNPGAAVPVLQGSVQGFRDQGRKQEIDYAFALYNLANALRLSGRPAEAIPLLEERLHISDYKRGVVRRELKVAREQAGSQG